MGLKPLALEMMPDKLGVWGQDDMPADEYHALPGASPSQLSCFAGVTDAEALAAMEELDPNSPFLVLGSICHQAVLEPGKEMRLVEIPPHYLNDRGEKKPWSGNATVCKTWIRAQRAAGMIPLKKSSKKGASFESMEKIVRSLRTHAVVRDLLTYPQTETELSIICRNADPEVMIRHRFDIVTPPELDDILWDVKVTSEPGPGGFQFRKKVLERHYYIQAAMGLDLWNAENPSSPKRRFRFIAVGSAPPHLVVIHELEPEWIALGRSVYPQLLARFVHCYRTGIWAGYPDDFVNHVAYPKGPRV